MNKEKAQGIVTASLVITLILGSLNGLYKNGHLPRFRLYFGTGILYLMLTGLAEFEAEIAQNIAIAILIFTVLGEGGGVIDHLLGAGAAEGPLDTRPPKNQAGVHPADIRRDEWGSTAPVGTAFFAPIKPTMYDPYQVTN